MKKNDYEGLQPAIAREMKRAGFSSLRQLWRKAEPLMLENPDFFQGVNYRSVNKLARGYSINANEQGDDYKRSAYAIAAVLNKSVEEIFGPLHADEDLPDPILYRDHMHPTRNYDRAMHGPAIDVYEAERRRRLGQVLANEFHKTTVNFISQRYGLETVSEPLEKDEDERPKPLFCRTEAEAINHLRTRRPQSYLWDIEGPL